MTPPTRPKCRGKNRRGTRCGNYPVPGAEVCSSHGGKAPQVASKAAVRAEVMRWGLTDQHADPGEVLLRLVTQSSARVQRYSTLLEEAYDAAERLRVSHEAHGLLSQLDTDIGSWVDPETGQEEHEPPAVQQAKADLDRIFNLGGVASLVGNTYSASNSGALYATGEAIRGLAKLEADERDRCAGFAAKAVAAGLAERSVRLAEKQGAMIAEVLRAVLGDPALALSEEQRAAAPDTIRRHLTLLAS
jgi:hypothetical protein